MKVIESLKTKVVEKNDQSMQTEDGDNDYFQLQRKLENSEKVRTCHEDVILLFQFFIIFPDD